MLEIIKECDNMIIEVIFLLDNDCYIRVCWNTPMV